MQYEPSFVGLRPILSDDDKHWLLKQSLRYSLDRFKGDQRNYEEVMVDFVYTSAKIEGNTYDRIDTDNLLRMGVTAGGKRYSDAVMLVNLRDGFDKVMSIEATDPLDLDYLCDLHKLLMRDLLPLNEQGIVRTSDVQIGASSYIPITDTKRLRTEMQFVLDLAKQYTNPFEQAIYLHCNVAYLQYFRDGNKRTARLMQTAALIRAGILPLFFRDAFIENYQRATVRYYETGDYASYVSFFKENYQAAVASLAGGIGDGQAARNARNALEAIEFERRIAALPALIAAQGETLEKIFGEMAEKAVAASGSPHSVNWADVERQAIVRMIEQSINHCSTDGDAAAPGAMNSETLSENILRVIAGHSPGVLSQQDQQAIDQDIKKLVRHLRAEQTRSRPSAGRGQ